MERSSSKPAIVYNSCIPPEINLQSLLSVDEFDVLARERLTHMAYEYLASGVADEITLQDNRAAFDALRILPRALIDVSRLDASVMLFGRRHAYPVLLAPAAYQRLFHAEAELAAVQAANETGITMVAATFSNTSIEDMAAASSQPLWFQLYIQPDRTFNNELIQRAEAAGCEALCICIDMPVNGPRYREQRAQFALPPGAERANLRSLGSRVAGAAHRPTGKNIYTAVRACNATWADIEQIAAGSKLPVIVKGILNAADAVKAIDSGCKAVIISNHGGRSLDTVPASLDVLPAIADQVQQRIPLLLDGGVRRGTDIFKALALGASAVLIGRPYLHGMAVAGPAGVSRVIEILCTEFEMAMGMAGCTSLSEITPRSIWRRR